MITCDEFMAEFGNYLEGDVPSKSANSSKVTSPIARPARWSTIPRARLSKL